MNKSQKQGKDKHPFKASFLNYPFMLQLSLSSVPHDQQIDIFMVKLLNFITKPPICCDKIISVCLKCVCLLSKPLAHRCGFRRHFA